MHEIDTGYCTSVSKESSGDARVHFAYVTGTTLSTRRHINYIAVSSGDAPRSDIISSFLLYPILSKIAMRL